MQIYVKDDVGVTDLQILTVQVTDVNEPPEFQGNLAKGTIHWQPRRWQHAGPWGTQQNGKVNKQAAVSLEKAAA